MTVNNLVFFAYESVICMAALYGIYWIFLRKESYFQFNRFYLLATVIFACVIPWLNVQSFDFHSGTTASDILAGMGKAARIPEVIIAGGSENMFSRASNWQYLIIIIYMAGAVLLLARMFHAIMSVTKLMRNGDRIKTDGYSVVYIKKNVAPFSFFRTIFINRSSIKNSQRISVIDHEVVHIRQLHTYDNIIVEILLALFWFNPFMWLIRRSLRNTHEYLADNGVKRINTNLAKYQTLLLEQINGSSPLYLTNNFNSIIKNRIIMMNKRKSTVPAKLKPLLTVPLILCLVMFFACSDSDNELITNDLTAKQKEILQSPDNVEPVDEELFFIVEEMPSFQGSSAEAFRDWIGDHLQYPEKAEKKGINGKVYVQFVVSSTGKVRNVTIVRGVHPDLDAEAVRVVESSPDWIPGKQRGKNVAVQFTFPINFILD